MSNFRKLISISAIAVLGVTNLLTPMSYASAENLGNYDSINFPLSGEAARSFSFIMPNHDVFLYATTEANKYFVQYSGTTKTSGNMPNEEYTYDTSGDLVANTYAKTGYTFSGWNRQPNGGGTGYADGATGVVYNWTAVESGVVPIYAQWNANRYYITYDLNDTQGTSSGVHSKTPTSGLYDETLTIARPSRTGYIFSGWKITGMDSETHVISGANYNGTTKDHEMATSYKNLHASGGTVKFMANWDKDKVRYVVEHFKETFTENEYTIKMTGDTLDTSGRADDEITPAVKTYDGFTSPNAITTGIKADGTTYVRYNYDRNSYDLKLTAGRGIASVKGTGTVNTIGDSANYGQTTTISFKYEEPVKISFVLKDGYENGTWSGYLDDDATFNMPAFSTGKTAYATPITYTITYNPRSGTVSPANPTSYTVESSGITLNNPDRIHSKFAGWTGGVIGGTQLAGPTMTVTIPTGSTGNRSYTATWTCLSGYHLKSDQTECMPDEDTEYKVKHYFQQLTGGENFDLIDTTTQTGETEQNTDAKTIAHTGFTVRMPIDNVPITGDGSTTVSIRYERNSYTGTIASVTGITGAKADGEYADGPYKYDDEVTLTADTLPGYTFDHWEVKDAGGNTVPVTNSGSEDGATFNMPASSVTITPKVTRDDYTITMILHNGTGTYPATYTVESPDIPLATPTRDTGSVFVGWSGTELAGTQPTVTITKGSVGNRTYEAIWSCRAGYHAVGDSCVANNYNVVVNPDDGEHPSADPVVFTYDEWKKVDEPEQSGYDFVGWEITGMSGGVEHYIGTITVTDSGTTYTGEVGSGFMNLTTVESGTVTFKALWEARNDTPYKVYHYYQNTGDNQYVLSGTAVEYSGTTDKPVDLNSVMENTFGFHNHAGSGTDGAYTGGSASGPNGTAKTVITIDKHGDTVIYFYYDRNVRNVYLSGDAHVTGLSGSGAYKYGQDVTVTATVQSGYHFKAWVKKNSKAELGIQ